MLREIASTLKVWPERITTIISLINFSIARQSICGPRKVISLPRTVTFTDGKAASIANIWASCAPTSETIGIAGGIVIRRRSI